jgi:hypothetical protein
MKVKAFQIRLEDEYLFTDQNNLNIIHPQTQTLNFQ